MKKYLYCLAVLLSINPAQAQMNEMMGVLGIGATLDANSYKSVGTMNSALGRMQLQQDIGFLVTEIQSKFMQNYLDIDVSLLSFNGLHGVNWNVVPVSSAEFYIDLQNIDAGSCFLIKGNPWGAKRIEINDGQDCQNSDNSIKLYF
ncbi:MAG: hypothetical protein J6K16_07025 [Alphaproteobacteria bacterium]|nr:hypothetical protein [Alphaproteobacteria bacterium]